MHRRRWLLSLPAAAILLGCFATRRETSAPVLPPNTIQLSQMMREQPAFADAMLAELNKHSAVAGTLLTPSLVDTMRKLILGRDWQGLDAFPGWTIHAINDSVGVVDHMVSQSGQPTPKLADYIDLGPYTIDKPATVDLDKPSDRPGFSTQGLISDLGYGVTRGDGPDPRLAPMHAESARLAEVMNRLSLNALDDAKPFTATIGKRAASTPEQLLANMMAAGDDVTVADARYFVNFGHLHSNGRDVMTPFLINTQILVPAEHFWQRRHALLEPVAHAEYEIIVTDPHDASRNADVVYYFGVDGKAEFRTNDQLNHAWVMGRHAHEYRGADAVEVTRLSGLSVLMYMHEHLDHPDLPFGGYYALGVCQDTVAAIELKMTGHVTLFPMTRDAALFTGTRDAEMKALLAQIPNDRDSTKLPEPERIFGSLPTTDLSTITVPGLNADLERTNAAWQRGDLSYQGQHRNIGIAAVAVLVLLLLTYGRARRYLAARDSSR